MSPAAKLDKTYWGIGHADDQYAQRYLYESESAARSAMAGTDFDVLERVDPDGSKTLLS